jgi:hypothetical protein
MPYNCYSNTNLASILFCPLGPKIVQEEEGEMQDNGVRQTTNNPDKKQMVNVEYRWSQHRGVTEHFVMRDEFQNSTAIMAWDVIALRDIAIGETVRSHWCF